MQAPSWFSRLLVSLTSATLVIALTAGGIWLTRHPFPQVSMAPVATVVGLAALVYSSRNKS